MSFLPISHESNLITLAPLAAKRFRNLFVILLDHHMSKIKISVSISKEWREGGIQRQAACPSWP